MSSFFDEFMDETGPELVSEGGEITGPIVAVDVGHVHTRAVIFDTAEGMYQLYAQGEVPSTAADPWNDIQVGIKQALTQLSEATGRPIFDQADTLITPARTDYTGIDALAATISGGKPIRAILVGLMPQMSLRSAERSAQSTYFQTVDTIHIEDGRTPEERLLAVTDHKPDVLVITGGTDGGAQDAMRRMINVMGLACSLIDENKRPSVIYAGNAELQDLVKQTFDMNGVQLLTAGNVRPSLDEESPAEMQVAAMEIFDAHQRRHQPGYDKLLGWAGGAVFPSSQAFAQMIEVLGQAAAQNVLGIDIGSGATSAVAFIDGEVHTNIMNTLGMGYAARKTLDLVDVEDVGRWLFDAELDTDEIRDMVWNKWVYPHSLPGSSADREVTYGLAREIAHKALDPLPSANFDAILISGAVLTRTPTLDTSIMLALDSTQPIGVTRLLSDPYGLAPLIGAILPISPRAVVQVLDTGSFTELATTVCLSQRGEHGTTALTGVLNCSDGREITFEVMHGQLHAVTLEPGISGTLDLTVTGKGELPGIAPADDGTYSVPVEGSLGGIIIDARGRPLHLPRDDDQRREQLRGWHQWATGETA